LVIAWIYFLLKIAKQKYNLQEIVDLGFISEVEEFGESGGKQDHFASSFGGLFYMHPDPKFILRFFPRCQKEFMKSLILIDSEQKKTTVEDLQRIKEKTLKSFEEVRNKIKNFNQYTMMFL